MIGNLKMASRSVAGKAVMSERNNQHNPARMNNYLQGGSVNIEDDDICKVNNWITNDF